MGPTALARGHRLELEPTQTRLIARPIESRSPREPLGVVLGAWELPWASKQILNHYGPLRDFRMPVRYRVGPNSRTTDVSSSWLRLILRST